MSDKNLIKQQWLLKYPRTFPKPAAGVRPAPGAIAVSRAGRDRYRRFIVLEVERAGKSESCDRVYLADGVLRSVASPKKKSLGHLIITGMSGEAAMLIARGKLTDRDAERIVKEAGSECGLLPDTDAN